jgi:hypothetical protein
MTNPRRSLRRHPAAGGQRRRRVFHRAAEHVCKTSSSKCLKRRVFARCGRFVAGAVTAAGVMLFIAASLSAKPTKEFLTWCLARLGLAWSGYDPPLGRVERGCLRRPWPVHGRDDGDSRVCRAPQLASHSLGCPSTPLTFSPVTSVDEWSASKTIRPDRSHPSRTDHDLCRAQGPKVRGLSAGGRWIRTIGPSC